MTIDDLRPVWRSVLEQESHIDDASFRSVRHEISKLNRAVRFRDFWFIFAFLAATIMSVFFNVLARDAIEGWALFGVVWGIAFFLIVTTALVWARLSRRSDDWTLRSRFEFEIARLEKQKWLLDKIHYWFLGPMAAGIVLSAFLREPEGASASSLWIYFVASAIVISFTYWVCKRESKTKFGPLLARLRELHRDLVTDVNSSERVTG